MRTKQCTVIERVIGCLAFALVSLATLRTGLAQTPSYATIHIFAGGAGGDRPLAGVILGRNSALYGTTVIGGTGSGTVFELAPKAGGTSWTYSVLHSFNGEDGYHPVASLVFGRNGVLYGTTVNGGFRAGNVFELAPPAAPGGAWTETSLYAFGSSLRGGAQYPHGGLLIGPSGALFGTTVGALRYSGGTVFELTPPIGAGSWTESTLVDLFTTHVEGINPYAGLVAEGGAFYGTTYFTAGVETGGCGSAYQVKPPGASGAPWTAAAIYVFGSAPNDGCSSAAPLTAGSHGVLYGTTYYGGSLATPCFYPFNPGAHSTGCGTVFELIPPLTPGGTWTETVIYNFTGLDGDGAYPSASLVLGKNGELYGTTEYGGSATGCTYYGATGCGIVFELRPPGAPGGVWTETVLHSFTGQSGDGAVPQAGLMMDANGVLFGTTAAGGLGYGTVFALKP